MSASRAQIVGWTVWIGGCLAVAAYVYYQTHTPAFINAANAQRAADQRTTEQAMARVSCVGDMEARDDGRAPPEDVARAIIARCGPIIGPAGPSCSADPKCTQAEQQISLQVETEGVLSDRYERAQARADDAKAAYERGRDALMASH